MRTFFILYYIYYMKIILKKGKFKFQEDIILPPDNNWSSVLSINNHHRCKITSAVLSFGCVYNRNTLKEVKSKPCKLLIHSSVCQCICHFRLSFSGMIKTSKKNRNHMCAHQNHQLHVSFSMPRECNETNITSVHASRASLLLCR